MYAKILVPVDGSQTAMGGLREALRLAKTLGSSVRVLHVVNDLAVVAGPEAALYTDELLKSFRTRGEAIVAEAQTVARQEGVVTDGRCVEVAGGPAGQTIVDQAQAWPADLIVLGTHGRRGLYRLVLGSDAEYVVRTSTVPVLLVRGPRPAATG